MLIEEKDLDGKKLYGVVTELCGNKDRLREMEKAALSLAKTDAAAVICEETEKVMEERKKR